MNLKNPFDNQKKSRSYLLRNGSVIDPQNKSIEKIDILIKNKVIESIEKNISINWKTKADQKF